MRVCVLYPVGKIANLIGRRSKYYTRILIGFVIVAAVGWFGTSWIPRRTRTNPTYQEYIRLFDIFDLTKEPRQFSKQEVDLTFKFWELKSWILNLLKTAEKQNISLEQVKSESDPPEFFNFSNYNLWGDGDFYSNGTDDRILGQAVWRMQNIIGNYMRSRGKPGEDGATRIKPKKIFVGEWRFWGWVASMKAKGALDDLCENDIFGRVYARMLKPYRPTCEKHTKKLDNWNDFDAIASFSGWSSGHWAGTKHMENQYSDIPTNIPWFIFVPEPPHRNVINVRKSGQQHLVTFQSSSVTSWKYSTWIYYNPHIRSNEQDVGIFETKTRMAATMISNCKDVFNDRIGFIRELQKYTTVDFYGTCGDKEFRNSCSRSQRNLICFEQMGKTYKFYLSFENSNCRDYITEKFQRNGLMNNMIPVVMGAHPVDYKHVAPDHSFIHVDDFESPRQLAEYLEFVGNNREVYNSYFRWRGTGEFFRQENLFCTVCPMLYYGDLTETAPPLQRYNYSVNAIISSRKDVLCLPKSQWYWNK